MPDGPQLVVRVAANLSELKSNLAEGISQIETYQTALSRASYAYDGSRIVQQASAAAAAIQQVGGVANLTAAEQAKANALFAEAATKLQLMGQGGTYTAKAFADLADATHQNLKPNEDLGQSWVARIAEGMLLRDVIRDVVAKGQELIIGIPEEAHALNILSLQTQINVEDLQVLSAATRAYGVDGDELGRALYQLSKRIAGGDESVATAYHLMGMSLEQVKDMNAMDLFLATERGLGKLEGSIRDTAAADLYGGRLGVSMGAFSTGVDEAIDKARRLNTIASADSVKAAADYAEAIDRATHSLHAWVMEVEGGAASGFNTLTAAADKGVSKWSLFVAMLQDWGTTITLGTPITANLTKVLDDANRKVAAGTDIVLQSTKAHVEANVALDAHAKAAQFMAAVELDSAKPLLEWQTEYLGHLKEIGLLTAKNAAAIGVNADQFKAYEAGAAALKKYNDALAELSTAGDGWRGTLDTIDGSVEAAIEYYLKAGVSQAALATAYELTAAQVQAVGTKLKDQALAIEQSTKLWDEYNTLVGNGAVTATQKAGEAIDKWAADLAAKAQKAGTDTQEFYDALAAVQDQKWQQLRVDGAAITQALTTNTKAGLQEIADRAQATFQTALGLVGTLSDSEIQHFRELADAAQLAADKFGTGMGDAFDKVSQKAAATNQAIKSAIDSVTSFSLVGAKQGMTHPDGSPYSQEELVSKGWITPFTHEVTVAGAAAGFGTGQGGVTGAQFRAAGGPIEAGKEYIVGEQGPEKFVSPINGSIIPNGGGSGGGVTLTIAPGAIVLNYPFMNDPRAKQEIARLFGSAVIGEAKRQGVKFSSGA